MSLATHSQSRCECAYCGGERDKHDSVGGSYCSPLCWHKHKGQKLYNTIRHDHKHCVNCGATLKSVEEPTDEQLRQIQGFHSTTAVVGYEYSTPNAEEGQKPLFNTDGDERVVSALICGECGNTSHNKEFPESQNRFLFEYASEILDTLQSKSEEHHTEIHEETFFEMLRVTDDLVFSLGKAAHV